MNRAVKQDYIIEKCYKLLLTKGFDGVSISDIQKECNVARGLLYHYFGGKKALFYEVVSKIVFPKLHISTEATSNMNLREVLIYMCDQYYQMCLNDGIEGVSLLNFDFLVYRATQESAEIKLQYEMIRRQERMVVKLAIERSIANGEMISSVEANDLSTLTISLIDGIWMSSLFDGEIRELFKRMDSTLSLHLQLLNHK